jgi:transposase InsO family protein
MGDTLDFTLEMEPMAWAEESVMDQRLCFIAASLLGEEPMVALCARFGISRKTGYKWLHRYDELGAVGLEDRSSARHTIAQAMDGKIAAAVLSLRRERPSWGPRKLLAYLGRERPRIVWPAASTVGDLLKRERLSRPRQRRSREPGRERPQIEPAAPNDSWAADFKGWFRTADGVRCEPLTVTDGHSRYLLACQALPRTTTAEVQPVMTELFRAHGLPGALRTDNGAPFASRTGLGGLTGFSVWLLRLDIWPDRIAPGRPDQNGRHERMHRTLGEETASPPARTLAAQQAKFDAWRRDFNANRPHEGLAQRCPGEVYRRSTRALPDKIRPWDYPADHQTRRVTGAGIIRWRDETLYLSEALKGETIGLAQRDDGDWAIRFRNFDLATLDDATNAIRRSGLARSGKSGA